MPNRKSSTSAKLELFMAAVEGADGTTEKIGRGEPNADETAALLATISADLDAKDALGTVEQLETAASVLAPVANAVKESIVKARRQMNQSAMTRPGSGRCFVPVLPRLSSLFPYAFSLDLSA